MSVDPRHRYPLRGRLNAFDGVFQRHDRLVDVVVDDRQVEVVAVRLTEHVRLAGQPLQAAVKLKVEVKIQLALISPQQTVLQTKLVFRAI